MKEKIRNELKNLRDNLNIEEKKILDKMLFQNILSLKSFTEAKSIFTFVSFRSEVDTQQIIRWAIGNGKEVSIPKVDLNTHEIVPYLITDIDKDTDKGHFNILEPDTEKTKRIDISQIEIFLVPGLAFDATGHRVGYGGQYFDKFLKHIPKDSKQIKIGLAYDFQIIEKVPNEEWDIPVDVIVTDKKIILVGAGSKPAQESGRV